MLWGSFIQPALLLIDHGHFQYNTISLGLAVSTMPCSSELLLLSVICNLCISCCHSLIVEDLLCEAFAALALTVFSCRLELLPLLPVEGMCWAASCFPFP